MKVGCSVDIHDDKIIQLGKNICGISIYGNDICIVNAFFFNHAHAPAVETFTANGTDSTREIGWEF